MLKKSIFTLFALFAATLSYGQSDSLSSIYYDLIRIIETEDITALEEVIGERDIQVFEPAGDVPLLFFACSVGDSDKVRFLLSRGAYPNHISKYGTAANWAAEKKHLHIIQLLLDNGFNPQIEEMSYWVRKYQSEKEMSPAWMSEIISELLQKKISYDNLPYMEFTDPADPLLLTAAILFDTTNTFTLAKEIMEKGVNVNVHDKRGLNALHWSINFLRPEAVSLLTEQEADVNLPVYSQQSSELFKNIIFDDNLTPLHLLFYQINQRPELIQKRRKDIMKILKMLIKAGADPYIKRKTNPQTVFEIAQELNDRKIMRILGRNSAHQKP